jgi:hypothetical protein
MKTHNQFIKTISLLLLLISASQLNAQTEGDALFSPAAVHTIQLTFTQGNYWNQLTSGKAYDDANDTSTYIPATVTIDGTLLDSVGIQLKGNSSYYNYPGNKKPFTLSFDEYIGSQRFDGLRNINLNNGYQDPTLLREKLFLDFLNGQGLYAPRANYAKLYINSTYWGLYLMVERVDKNFCKNRVGNKQGNLFKGDNAGASCATLQYHGVMSAYYNCYELKTNTTANDWSDLVNLTYEIYATDNNEFKDSIEAIMNTPSFIGAWAACNLFVEFDSYAFRYPHNYYIYHNTATDKFDWITWDASTAFGMDVPGTVSQIENTSVLYTTPPATNHPLTNRMLADSFYLSTYLNTVCRYANYDFLPSVLNPKIDALANLIRTDYYADTQKQYTNQNFEDNIINNIVVNNYTVLGLKSFITNRSSSVLTELYGLGEFCDNSLAPPLNCDSFCVVSIAYDTANDYNLFITISNNDTNFINYPIVQLIDSNGDTIANQQSLFEFYGQLPNTTQIYHIPTLLDSLPSNWSGQVRLEDGLYHTSCIIDFPCEQMPTGVSEINKYFDFTLYPNPTHDYVFIKTSEKIASVKILDVFGRLVEQPVIAAGGRIDISQLQKGVYIFMINDTATRKVVVISP